jgi:hypothetical protein
MPLYNAKKANGTYRVTKFDDDLEVENSYLTSERECTCPAGHRDTCRHRQMLPAFIEQQRVDTFWFLDWDNQKWADPLKRSWRRL